MPEVISFDEAIARTKGKIRTLLLGNGFSVKYFSYSSLLDAAGLKETDPLKQLFKTLDTADFESVMRALDEASVVEKAYKNDKQAKIFSDDAARLRAALIQAITHLRPNAAVYGRVAWLLDPLRRCPLHRVQLVPTNEDAESVHTHDFAYHVATILPRLPDLAASAVARDLSPIENYALARLAGRAASPLLDPMPLGAAVRLCETAGAVLVSGPKVDTKRLSRDERHAARDRGCEAIAAGGGAFRALLDRLIEASGPRKRMDGPSVAFGRLFTLLSRSGRDDASYDAVREITRGHIVENFALARDFNLFGRPVERRRIHTVHTLAKEHAIHPKTLRKHLKAAGLINADQAKMSDNNVRIDAEAAIGIARQLVGTLSRPEAMKHINAPRPQLDVLIKAGIVAPQQRMTGFGAQNRYALADLDDVMSRLTAKARSVRGHDASLCDIPTAAKRCHCSAAEIVRLVLDGKVRTTKSSQRLGYMGVLVDAGAVLKLVRGPETDALSLRKAARAIGTSAPALKALIAGGHIAAFTGINSVNRCPQTLVANKELKRFKANYVSLWTLSKERAMYSATLKSELDRAGIEPAFDPLAIGARFYAHKDLSKAKSEIPTRAKSGRSA